MTATSIRQTIFKNTLYLFAGDIGVRLISTVATVFLARYLGPTEFGIYSVAFALASVVCYSSDLGLGQTYIREKTRDGGDYVTITGGLLKAKIFLALLATILAVVLIMALYDSGMVRTICLIMTIPCIIGSALNGFGSTYFSAAQKMKYVALIRSTHSLMNAGTLFLGIWLGWSLKSLAVAPGLSLVLSGFLGIFLVHKHVGKFTGWCQGLFKNIGFFAAAGILAILAQQVGPLILEKVTTFEEIGYFAAIYRIPMLLIQAPAIVASAYFPQLYKYSHNDSDNHFSLSISQFRVICFLCAGLVLPVTLEADWIVLTLFGSQWEGRGAVLLILAGVVLAHGISRPLADSITTLGYQSKRVKVLSISIGIGSLCYFLLGSYAGALGGAVSALLVEFGSLCGFFYYNKRKIEFLQKALPTVIQVLFGVLTTITLLRLLPFESEILSVIFAAPLFYVIVALFFKNFRNDLAVLFLEMFSHPLARE